MAGHRWPIARRSPKTAQAEGRFVRQSGGRGQFGDVWIRVEPLERGKGFEFVNGIVGGVGADASISSRPRKASASAGERRRRGLSDGGREGDAL